MQRRVTMRFRWVMGVAGIHVVCALASFSFYYNLKWITLALTPLAAELVALSLALLLTSLLIGLFGTILTWTYKIHCC